MQTKLERRDWKIIGLTAGLAALSMLLILSLFTFIIEPAITDKPEIKLISREPKYFNEGELVTFNVSLENRGKITASELFIYAIEVSNQEDLQIKIAEDYDLILQSGDITNAIFTFKAPENQESVWGIEIRITTTDGYYWEFDIMYEYQPDLAAYHIIPIS